MNLVVSCKPIVCKQEIAKRKSLFIDGLSVLSIGIVFSYHGQALVGIILKVRPTNVTLY